MEELLFGLTPAEFWVWNYLIYLARSQGGLNITLPRPGEDPKAEKVFCRKHLKNLLKSLKGKRRLTHLIIPRSKAKRIEIFLPASKVGELEFRNREKGYLEFPNKEALGNRGSPKEGLGNCGSPNLAVIQATLGNLGPSQAKLKEKLEKLLKELKQGDLKKMILSLSNREIFEVTGALRQLLRVHPKGKKLSEQAKIYAMVRLLQAGDGIEKPQAWVDNVARAAEKEMRGLAWKGVLSGSGGKLPSPKGSGDSWGSTRANF
jgi:hypothetical protein